MNYESHAFVKSILKKMIIPFILFLIIIILEIFNYVKTPPSMVNHLTKFYSFTGIVTKKEHLNLIFIFQIFLTLLINHFYFDYEKENSLEFTKTRISQTKLYFQKLIIITIFIIIIRSIYYYIIYKIFSPQIIFKIQYYILSLYPHLTITLIYYLYKTIYDE